MTSFNRLLGLLFAPLLYSLFSITSNLLLLPVLLVLDIIDYFKKTGPLVGILFLPVGLPVILLVTAFRFLIDVCLGFVVGGIGGATVGLTGALIKLFTETYIIKKLSTGIERIFFSGQDEKTSNEPANPQPARQQTHTHLLRRFAPQEPSTSAAIDLTQYLQESAVPADKVRQDLLSEPLKAFIRKTTDPAICRLELQRFQLELRLAFYDGCMGLNESISTGVKTDALLDRVYEKNGQLHVVPGSTEIIRFTHLKEINGCLYAEKPKTAAEPYEGQPTQYRLYRFPKGGYCYEYEEIQLSMMAPATKQQLPRQSSLVTTGGPGFHAPRAEPVSELNTDSLAARSNELSPS